jgi:hypothetical protein
MMKPVNGEVDVGWNSLATTSSIMLICRGVRQVSMWTKTGALLEDSLIIPHPLLPRFRVDMNYGRVCSLTGDLAMLKISCHDEKRDDSRFQCYKSPYLVSNLYWQPWEASKGVQG